MRHALVVVVLVADLSLVAVSGFPPGRISHSADTSIATQDLGTLAVTGLTAALVALNSNDPFYMYPYDPFCLNGPRTANCFMWPN